MGNRAVIACNTYDSADSIYVHWNGGLASIEGFLLAAKDLGITPKPENLKVLANIIARGFFGPKVNRMNVYWQDFGVADTDNYDNGTYLIDGYSYSKSKWMDKWRIYSRQFKRYPEEVDQEKTEGIRKQITDSFSAFGRA